MGKVLIGCEFSGVVREAFKALGHIAISCDVLPTEQPGLHLQCDVRDILNDSWDLALFFPPCTHLASSGAAWFKYKQAEQAEALQFVQCLLSAPIPRIALENPIGVISTQIRKPDQIIQPWQFGHEATKSTCLWLKGLPKLVPTHIVGKGEFVTYASGKRSTMWHAKSGGGSGHKRSVTYQGVADAFAAQWGALL